MATSVASVWSVRDRSASPITRLYRPIDVSTLARRLSPLAFCHAMRPRSAAIRQVTVALCRGGLGRGTRNRACPWRRDDGSGWMTLGNRLAGPGPDRDRRRRSRRRSDGSIRREAGQTSRASSTLFFGLTFDSNNIEAARHRHRYTASARIRAAGTCHAFDPARRRLRSFGQMLFHPAVEAAQFLPARPNGTPPACSGRTS